MTDVLTSSASVDNGDDVAVFSGSALSTKHNDVTRRLFTAVRSSDATAVAQIFHSPDGTDVDHDSRDHQGHTCIRIAIDVGNLEIIELLLQNGVNLNKADFYGKTPLQYATENGDCDVVELLLKSGAEVNFIEDGRLSALHTAALTGQLEIIKKFIQRKCNVNILTIKGESALHCATVKEHIDIFRLLLAAGANVNFREQKYRRTPVSLASEIGNVAMIADLIRHGAKLNLIDKYGLTPLSIACHRQKWDAAKQLIEAGVNVNTADDKGNLPLHYAARSGNTEVALMLLNAGSQINVLNKNGESPLHLAVRMQHTDIVQVLVAFGCIADIREIPPDAEDWVSESGSSQVAVGGETALYVAVGIYGDVDDFETVLRLLIDGGCRLDTPVIVRSSTETALYRALDVDKADFAWKLVQRGADVDVECPHGVTILNKACQRGMYGFVRLLTVSSWRWRYEPWLARPNTTGFRPRNLGRFLEDTFDDAEVPMCLWNRIPLHRFLRDAMSQPLNLQQICRLVIRRRMMSPGGGGDLFDKIDQLRYPTSLKSFLKLCDVQ